MTCTPTVGLHQLLHSAYVHSALAVRSLCT